MYNYRSIGGVYIHGSVGVYNYKSIEGCVYTWECRSVGVLE